MKNNKYKLILGIYLGVIGIAGKIYPEKTTEGLSRMIGGQPISENFTVIFSSSIMIIGAILILYISYKERK